MSSAFKMEAALELERVRLRPFREDDAAALFAMYADAQTSRYLSRPPLTKLSEAEEIVAKAISGYAEGKNLQLAIERKDDRAFLGICMLVNLHKDSARAEIGYTLDRAHWSQGYMREALAALVAHAFGPLGLNRLEADIDPRNVPSARILENLGFKQEGTLRDRWIVSGEASDSAIYGLLRKEWLERSLVTGA